VLLLNDSIILYGALNDGLLHLLDIFWKLHQKEAKKVVDIYKLFIKETDALINLYEIGRRFINKLPQVTRIEGSIIDQMESYAVNQAPQGSGVEDYDDRDEDEDNRNDFLNTQATNYHYDEGAYGNQGSVEEEDESDSDDEEDPFKDFITGANNPFTGFTFSQPVFQSPYALQQPVIQQPVNPNQGFQTNPYVQPSPLVISNPGTTYQNTATVTVNPFATNPFASNQAPLFNANPTPSFTQPTTFVTPQPTPYQNPQPNANPFATNPFASQPTNQFTPSPQTFAQPQPTASPFGQPQPVQGGNPFATNPFSQPQTTPF